MLWNNQVAGCLLFLSMQAAENGIRHENKGPCRNRHKANVGFMNWALVPGEIRRYKWQDLGGMRQWEDCKQGISLSIAHEWQQNGASFQKQGRKSP